MLDVQVPHLLYGDRLSEKLKASLWQDVEIAVNDDSSSSVPAYGDISPEYAFINIASFNTM
jgi:hypothetical protein